MARKKGIHPTATLEQSKRLYAKYHFEHHGIRYPLQFTQPWRNKRAPANYHKSPTQLFQNKMN